MDPTQLTDADVERYVREIAAQEAAKASGTPGGTPDPAPQEPAKFKMTIGGQEMEFSSPEEASNAVNAALYQASAAAANPQGANNLPGQRVTDDNGTRAWSKEDQAKYVDLLTTNPVAAAEYVDEFRFGVSKPTELLKRNIEATQNLSTQMTIKQFVEANDDYVPTPENAAVMQKVLTELGGGRPVVTPTALEAAFAIAERRGLLAKPQANQPSNREANPYLRTPPAGGRNSASAYTPEPDFVEQAENMSLESIEKFFSRHGR